MKTLIAILLLCACCLGQNITVSGGTTGGNIYPAATGQDLGSTTQRWDAFLQSLDIQSFAGVRYAAASTMQADITAACNGTDPGAVRLPSGTTSVTATITIPSNCAVLGSGKYGTTLQASGSGMNSSNVLSLSSASNVQLADFTVDGNRSSVTSATDINITNSTNVRIRGVLATNAGLNGIALINGNTGIDILDSEESNNGAALPSSSGCGICLDPGGSGTSGNNSIRISGNRIHDNNQGIFVAPDASSGVSRDIIIVDNHIYGNADDGVQLNDSGRTGTIPGPVISDNAISCNGWPANGTGFPTACTAGLLQTGASASTSGVCINLIGAGVQHASVTGNRLRDCTFDNFSVDGRTSATVNTSGTTVSFVSGTSFNTKWRANEAVLINGTSYLISSVTNSSTMVITSSAGTQSAVSFNGPSVGGDVIVGNSSYYTGTGTAALGGGFFNYWSDNNSYAGNINIGAMVAGYQCQGSAHVTFTGDQAYNNGRNGSTFQAGFFSGGCLEPQYFSVATDDFQSSATQLYGVYLDAQTNGARVDSTAVHGPTAAVNDLGAGNIVNVPGYLGSMPGSGTSSNSDDNGVITLSGGAGSYSFAGKYATNPVCTCTDNTAANAVRCAASTSTLTIAGTGTDVIQYACRKRN